MQSNNPTRESTGTRPVTNNWWQTFGYAPFTQLITALTNTKSCKTATIQPIFQFKNNMQKSNNNKPVGD